MKTIIVHKDYHTVEQALDMFMKWDKTYVAIDSETNGLSFLYNKVWYWILCVDDEVIILDAAIINLYDFIEFAKLQGYNDKTTTWVGANLSFDHLFALKEGYEFHKIYDVMIASLVGERGKFEGWDKAYYNDSDEEERLDSIPKGHSLADLCKRFLNVDLEKTVRDDFYKDPTLEVFQLEPRHIDYMTSDVVYLIPLMNAMITAFDKPTNKHIHYIANPFRLLCDHMTFKGIAVDVDIRQKWYENTAPQLEALIEAYLSLLWTYANREVLGTAVDSSVLEIRLDRLTNRLEKHTIVVNTKKPETKVYQNSAAHIEKILEEIAEVEKLLAEPPLVEYNINSSSQTIALWKSIKDTHGGSLPSNYDFDTQEHKVVTSKKVIEAWLKEADPNDVTTRVVKAYYEMAKLKNLVHIHGPNWNSKYLHAGRAHAMYHTERNTTGRMGCAGSKEGFHNILNVPKINELRNSFIAEPGKLMVTMDYTALEIVIACDFAKDLPTIELVVEKDPHSFLATECWRAVEAYRLFGLPFQPQGYTEDVLKAVQHVEVSKKVNVHLRDLQKTLFYAQSYGQSDSSAYKLLKITPDEWKVFKACLFHHVKFFQFLADNGEQALRDGYIELGSGIKRYFGDKYADLIISNYRKGSIKRSASNAPIQGTNAQMVKRVAIVLHRLFQRYPQWGARIVLIMHDEIAIEYLESQPQVADISKRVMIHFANKYLRNGATVKVSQTIKTCWQK